MTTPNASRAYLIVFALLAAVALMSGCSNPTGPKEQTCSGVIVHTEGAPDHCIPNKL